MKFYTRQRRQPQVIIVSLIDILAILLIFVIVTTTFKREQPAVVIKLPESESSAPSQATGPEQFDLTVTKTGEIHIGNTKVDEAQLKEELKKKAQEQKQPALNADTAAPFGVIIHVLDALKDAGYKDVPAFTELSQQ